MGYGMGKELCGLRSTPCITSTKHTRRPKTNTAHGTQRRRWKKVNGEQWDFAGDYGGQVFTHFSLNQRMKKRGSYQRAKKKIDRRFKKCDFGKWPQMKRNINTSACVNDFFLPDYIFSCRKCWLLLFLFQFFFNAYFDFWDQFFSPTPGFNSCGISNFRAGIFGVCFFIWTGQAHGALLVTKVS